MSSISTLASFPSSGPLVPALAVEGESSDASRARVSSAAGRSLSAGAAADSSTVLSLSAGAGAGVVVVEAHSMAGQAAYTELTRRIPREDMSLIEARMRELQASPLEVNAQIRAIKAHLKAGTYHRLPENCYYYGLLGVQSGQLSVELFSLVLDHLTLVGEGVVEKEVCPLFRTNAEGERKLNQDFARDILSTLRCCVHFDSDEAGYSFLEYAFRDLPEEHLHIQVYTPRSTPDTFVTFDQHFSNGDYEVSLVKLHDRPLGSALSQSAYNLLMYFKRRGQWKRLSVSPVFFQRFLDKIFKDNAVKMNLVMGNSSVEDIRVNGRTSSRDVGMVYIVPSEEGKPDRLQYSKYIDSYPAHDLDFRDHDYYHSFICSTIPKEAVRIPLINTADTLNELANIASYLIEKDPHKKRAKEAKLSYRNSEIAREIEKGTPAPEIIEKFALPERFFSVLEHLTNKDAQVNLKALRNMAWYMTDMEYSLFFSGYLSPDYSSRNMSCPIVLGNFARDFLSKIDYGRRFNTPTRLEYVKKSIHPLASRAREILEHRVIFYAYASPEAQYQAEMLVCDLGFFSEKVLSLIRYNIHGSDLEPSYDEWRAFRGEVISFSSPAVAAEAPAAEVVPYSGAAYSTHQEFMADLSVMSAQDFPLPLTEDLLGPVSAGAGIALDTNDEDVPVPTNEELPEAIHAHVEVARAAEAPAPSSTAAAPAMFEAGYAVPLTEDLLGPPRAGAGVSLGVDDQDVSVLTNQELAAVIHAHAGLAEAPELLSTVNTSAAVRSMLESDYPLPFSDNILHSPYGV